MLSSIRASTHKTSKTETQKTTALGWPQTAKRDTSASKNDGTVWAESQTMEGLIRARKKRSGRGHES